MSGFPRVENGIKKILRVSGNDRQAEMNCRRLNLTVKDSHLSASLFSFNNQTTPFHRRTFRKIDDFAGIIFTKKFQRLG